MEKRQIIDLVEMTANAKNQAQEHVIRDLQLSIKSVKTIMESFEKRFDSLEEMLTSQNKKSETHRELVQSHMERVEPMISAYEKDNAFSKMLGEKGKKWSIVILSAASVIGAWYVIKEFIIKLFIK